MRANLTVTATIAAMLMGLLSVPAGAQTTIFNTKDFRLDRQLWTNPSYYRNNTVGQLRGMALDIDGGGQGGGQVGSARLYGSEGTGRAGAMNFASPYPYQSALQHYQAWLREAGGGTTHTKVTIPDWSGRWSGGDALGGRGSLASDVAKLLTPKYQEYFVQDVKAQSEGRIWSAGAFCLPSGFFSALTAEEFIVTPQRVWTLGAGNGNNTIRWIYTDGSGHTSEQTRFPKWHGESIGFWNGDTLVVHTNQIRGWRGGLVEFSGDLETVERYRRVGNEIEGEITLYDPEVFVQPVYSKITYELDTEARLEFRPLYNTCTDTNGPSPKVYQDDKGLLNERLSGEGAYNWDVSDQRPWGTWLNESDAKYKAHLQAGGTPPGR